MLFDLLAAACMTMPNYKSNPKVPDIEDIARMLARGYDRGGG